MPPSAKKWVYSGCLGDSEAGLFQTLRSPKHQALRRFVIEKRKKAKLRRGAAHDDARSSRTAGFLAS